MKARAAAGPLTTGKASELTKRRVLSGSQCHPSVLAVHSNVALVLCRPETLFAIQGRSFPLWPMIVYTLYSTLAVCLVIFNLEGYQKNHILQGLITPLQNVGTAF